MIRLTEENKAFGRKLKQAPQRPKLGEEFGADGTDLPPRTRAMFEDNRRMKDRVKKYKDKVAQTERTITLQQQQVLKLQDKWTQPREVGLPRAPGKGSFSGPGKKNTPGPMAPPSFPQDGALSSSRCSGSVGPPPTAHSRFRGASSSTPPAAYARPTRSRICTSVPFSSAENSGAAPAG